MTYTTKGHMTQRYGSEVDELLDRDGDGTEDTGVFDTVAADTDAVINGYLSAIYVLPLLSVPGVIVDIACTICRYKLWMGKGPEGVRKDYEDAIKMLEKIRDGLIKLPDDTGTPIATTGGTIEFTTRERTFTDQTLRGFMGGC